MTKESIKIPKIAAISAVLLVFAIILFILLTGRGNAEVRTVMNEWYTLEQLRDQGEIDGESFPKKLGQIDTKNCPPDFAFAFSTYKMDELINPSGSAVAASSQKVRDLAKDYGLSFDRERGKWQ